VWHGEVVAIKGANTIIITNDDGEGVKLKTNTLRRVIAPLRTFGTGVTVLCGDHATSFDSQ